MDSNVELMDGVKDTTVYNRIFDAVEQVPGVCNPHRVRSRQIGNMYMIALDIEVDGDMSLNQAHDLAEQVENSIKCRVENVYDIVVHVEPKGKCHSAEKFGLDKEAIQ
jgi:divalent metal cation (Fe/Co/Zn/Cd) transporter